MKDLNVKNAKELALKNKASSDTLNVLDIFMLSINDWPRDVKTLYAYEQEVERFIKSITTMHNINNHLKIIDLKQNPWESESLFQIMDVFQYYKKGITLKEIIGILFSELKKGQARLG